METSTKPYGSKQAVDCGQLTNDLEDGSEVPGWSLQLVPTPLYLRTLACTRAIPA